MKKTQLTAAVLTALGLLLPAFLPQTVSANETEKPVISEKSAELPTWIPQDFSSALDFINSFGATHIDEDYVCLVFQEKGERDVSGEFVTVSCDSDALENVFEMHCVNPDENGYAQMTLHISVFRAVKAGTATITPLDSSQDASQGETQATGKKEFSSYEFSIDSDLNITETDIFGWLPDCAVEYENFTQEGEVRSRDNYMIFCLSSNAGTPYHWEYVESKYPENDVTPVFTQDCSPVTAIPLSGGKVNRIVLYQGNAGQKYYIQWAYRSVIDDTAEKTLVGDFQFTYPNAQVLAPGEALLEVYDAETGELFDMNKLEMPDGETPYFMITTDIGYYDPEQLEGDGWAWTGPLIHMDTNRIVDRSFGKWFSADYFSFRLSSPDKRYSNLEDIAVSKYENGSYTVRFFMHYAASGDATGDGQLSIADAVSVQKWILGNGGITAENWKKADMNNDQRIDATDLTRILRKLCEQFTETVTMHQNSAYGGRGIAGQFLSEGYDTRTITAQAGNRFYENNFSEWQRNVPFGYGNEEPIVTVRSITDEGVLVEIPKGVSEESGEILLPYGERRKLWTQYPICDGTSYTYTIWFEKPRNDS